MRSLINTAAALVIGSVAGFAASQATAAAFVAWEVSNVPFGDVLNVRKYPSSSSQKQAAYPNGTVLSMTGKCTGGVDLFDISGLPEWKQAQIVRYKWCQVWHDPSQSGDYVAGWVYGKFIRPD